MQKSFISVIILFLLSACSSHKAEQCDFVKTQFDFASGQLKFALAGIEKINEAGDPQKVTPRTLNADGSIQMAGVNDWTCGFFPGELWYMYEYTGDEFWKTNAENFTEKLEAAQFNVHDHDIGFRMYCSYGNAYRLTGNEKYKGVLLQSAQSLTKRYDPNIGLIRSWDFNQKVWQYPVIIDNMMNLELLFWASRETGDSTYYQIAVNHAQKTWENHFRADNSSYHVVDYDTITGQAIQKHTHQGYANESSWARGQAWGAYGFTICYRETKNPVFLEKAEQIIAFLFNHPHLPADLIPYWDYDAPGIPNEPRDVSASTITASALYELSLYNPAKAEQYRKWADTILENLSKNYRASAGGDGGFLLLHSTGHKPGNGDVDVPLIYADYYFLEALLRKNKNE
jgi:rhamnogalacturonyl hydrolase YesR